MFSIARPQRRLKLATFAALAATAGALAISGAIQASADDLGPFTCTDRSGGTAPAPGDIRASELTAVRVAHHNGYDRLVFEFGPSSVVPQYQLTRQVSSTFVRDASGQPVAVEGSAGIRAVVSRHGQRRSFGPRRHRPSGFSRPASGHANRADPAGTARGDGGAHHRRPATLREKMTLSPHSPANSLPPCGGGSRWGVLKVHPSAPVPASIRLACSWIRRSGASSNDVGTATGTHSRRWSTDTASSS